MKELFQSEIKTPLGELIALATVDFVYFLSFKDKENIQGLIDEFCFSLPANITHQKVSILLQLQKELDEYFLGTRTEFDIPLAFIGTDFQRDVWTQLTKISYGSTTSCKDIALEINNPKAVKAISHANNMNRILLLVPCHRVISENGIPTSYSAGIWRKKWLLEHESNFKSIILNKHKESFET
jgi:O-6-methylguanine DNA methyltransferase